MSLSSPRKTIRQVQVLTISLSAAATPIRAARSFVNAATRGLLTLLRRGRRARPHAGPEISWRGWRGWDSLTCVVTSNGPRILNTTRVGKTGDADQSSDARNKAAGGLGC